MSVQLAQSVWLCFPWKSQFVTFPDCQPTTGGGIRIRSNNYEPGAKLLASQILLLMLFRRMMLLSSSLAFSLPLLLLFELLLISKGFAGKCAAKEVLKNRPLGLRMTSIANTHCTAFEAISAAFTSHARRRHNRCTCTAVVKLNGNSGFNKLRIIPTDPGAHPLRDEGLLNTRELFLHFNNTVLGLQDDLEAIFRKIRISTRRREPCPATRLLLAPGGSLKYLYTSG